jgi:hypothetical protein
MPCNGCRPDEDPSTEVGPVENGIREAATARHCRVGSMRRDHDSQWKRLKQNSETT